MWFFSRLNSWDFFLIFYYSPFSLSKHFKLQTPLVFTKMFYNDYNFITMNSTKLQLYRYIYMVEYNDGDFEQILWKSFWFLCNLLRFDWLMMPIRVKSGYLCDCPKRILQSYQLKQLFDTTVLYGNKSKFKRNTRL